MFAGVLCVLKCVREVTDMWWRDYGEGGGGGGVERERETERE